MMGYLLSVLLVMSGQAPRIIASTSDWSLTQQQYDAIVSTFPELDRLRYIDPENRRALVNELVRIWVLCAEARKDGIAVGDDYESRKNYYQKYASGIAATITDETVRKYYDAHTPDFTLVGFSHILILNGDSPITPYQGVERLHYKEAENKAKEIKAMLDKGADWNELVQKYSQDLATKDREGAVGYLPTGTMEKSLENALLSLKIGEISDVVGSVYGFHILRLEDIRVKPFEDIRASIRQKIFADEVSRQLEPKVKAAGVTIDESFFQ
jgi:hypothetical protein